MNSRVPPEVIAAYARLRRLRCRWWVVGAFLIGLVLGALLWKNFGPPCACPPPEMASPTPSPTAKAMIGTPSASPGPVVAQPPADVPTATPSPTSPQIAWPLEKSEQSDFLRSWARYAIACWGDLIPASVDSRLPEKRGKCSILPADSDDGPVTKGFLLLHGLVAVGPTSAEASSPGGPGTCRGIWLGTARAILTLNESAERAFVLPQSIWRSKVEAGMVAKALSYLSGDPSPSDCDDLPNPYLRDLLSVRIDLAADMKQFDRDIGGWFGRDGGRSGDPLDAGSAMTTWRTWRDVLLQEAVAVSEKCYGAIPGAFGAAEELQSAANAVWGFSRGLRGFDSNFSYWESDVNEALDRDLPKAVAILESCS